MGIQTKATTKDRQKLDFILFEIQFFSNMAVTKTMVIGIFGLCIVAFSSASPSPQDGAPLPSGCRYEGYTTHYTTEYETKYEDKCTQDTKCECVDKSLKACKTYREDEPICNYVTEKICTTHYKGVCKSETIYVDEPYEGERCINEEHEKCEKRWITVGYSKVWENDPTTCIKVKETKCYKETQYKKFQKLPTNLSQNPSKLVKMFRKNNAQSKLFKKKNVLKNMLRNAKKIPTKIVFKYTNRFPNKYPTKKPVKKCDKY